MQPVLTVCSQEEQSTGLEITLMASILLIHCQILGQMSLQQKLYPEESSD